MVEFKDCGGTKCSIQASSLAVLQKPGTSAIWLGVDDVNAKVLINGVGWVPYPIHADVLLSTRMHLDRKQVEALINHLQNWLKKDTF